MNPVWPEQNSDYIIIIILSLLHYFYKINSKDSALNEKLNEILN